MAPSAIEISETYNEDIPRRKSLSGPADQGSIAGDAKSMVRQVMDERIANIDHQICQPGDEDAFFVADIGEVYRQHMRWKKNLKRVKPHYGQPPLTRHIPDLSLTLYSGKMQP